jgi:hypothetical protein
MASGCLSAGTQKVALKNLHTGFTHKEYFLNKKMFEFAHF